DSAERRFQSASASKRNVAQEGIADSSIWTSKRPEGRAPSPQRTESRRSAERPVSHSCPSMKSVPHEFPVKLRVMSATDEEFVVGAALDNLALAEQENLVRVPDR